MTLADSVFLITGAASGLGAGAARHFVAQGAKVVVADLQREAGERLAAELGPSARFAPCNVTDAREVEAAIQLAQRELGGLHGLVHCAGILGGARVVGRAGPHDLEVFRRVIEVNLVGAFNVVRLVGAALTLNAPRAEGERGVLITVSSVAAFEGQIGQAAYSAAKGGVAAMTLPIARELARHGIRVVSIAPGVFDTAMIAGLTPALRESLTAQLPFPSRPGRPEEFALLCEQIVRNPMLNGSVIRLDGALRMGAT